MAITAKDVQALRQATGVGMMDAKKALEASDGDMAAATKLLRVQAGAFASRPAADRAAARLAGAGIPSISPIERNGGTLYRVTVGGFPDADTAAEARARVIASGFADARVVSIF